MDIPENYHVIDTEAWEAFCRDLDDALPLEIGAAGTLGRWDDVCLNTLAFALIEERKAERRRQSKSRRRPRYPVPRRDLQEAIAAKFRPRPTG